MKKTLLSLLCVLLAVAAFALMAIASGSSDDPKPITDESGEASEGTETSEKKPIGKVTIEETVLLDKAGIKITAKEYVSDLIWGDGIKLLVENTTDKSVTVGCDALIVNNYMITDLFSCTVAAGKKTNETLYLSSSELKDAGIDVIGQVEIYFHAHEKDEYLESIFEKELATVKTSQFDQMDTTPNDSGKELYNANGIKIVGKYVQEKSLLGAAIQLYIENKTGKDVYVTCDDLSVNGFTLDALFYSTIYNGKMTIDDITLLSSDLEENEITSVDEIEVKFKVTNADDWTDVIVETDPITFTTK